MNFKFYSLLFLFFLIIFNLFAKENDFKKNQYCLDNKLGWRFYCDDEEEKIKEEENLKNYNQKQNYTERLKNLQIEIEESKAKAVLEPTEENVKNYMFLQQKVVNQASYFSDVWRRAVWNTPELDYTQQRPVSNIGKNVWQARQEEKNNLLLKNINKRYGIFFIYSTTCSFCQKYSDILLDFKKLYNVEIKGISVSGDFLSGWEKNSFINSGQLEALEINYKTVPVTILFDNIKQSVILVGYGLLTQDELINRIYTLTQTTIGEEY